MRSFRRFLGVVQAFLQAFALLFRRKNFDSTPIGQHALEPAGVVVALLQLLRHQVFDPHQQVRVTGVEDDPLALARHLPVHALEVVAGRPKLATRIRLDGAVLTAQACNTSSTLCLEQLLQRSQALVEPGQGFLFAALEGAS